MRSFFNIFLAGFLIGMLIALFSFTSNYKGQSNSKIGNIRKLQKKARYVAKNLL